MKRIILFLIGTFIFLSAEYIKKSEYDGRYGYHGVVSGDVNGNGLTEIYSPVYIFQVPDTQSIFVREYDANFNLVNETLLPFYGLSWDIGDINQNGLVDIVIQTGDPGMGGNAYLRIYEQSNPESYPDYLIANITLSGKKILHYSKYGDTDQDGKMEAIMSPNDFYRGGVRIYEWENNQLNMIWDWYGGHVAGKAIGDFNQNGQTEIAFAEKDTACSGNIFIHVFECTGDNSYQEIFTYSYNFGVQPTGEAFSLDFDGDDVQEFLISISSDIVGSRALIFKYGPNGYYLQYDLGENAGFIGVPAVTVADFDNDGKDELAMSILVWWIRIYNWTMNGVSEQNITTDEALGLFTVDINHNLYPDIYAVIFRSELPAGLFHAEFWEYQKTGISELTPQSPKENLLKITPRIGKIFKIDYPGSNQKISIYNHLGQLVQITKPGLIDFSYLPNGIYFVENANGQSIKITIIK